MQKNANTVIKLTVTQDADFLTRCCTSKYKNGKCTVGVMACPFTWKLCQCSTITVDDWNSIIQK